MKHTKHGKRKIIGTMRTRSQKPFPVAFIQLRPVHFEEHEEHEVCGMTHCQSEVSPAHALFMVRSFSSHEERQSVSAFSEKVGSELLWEKAYRSQLRGDPEPTIAYPMCAQCAVSCIAHHLGKSGKETDAMMAIAASISAGKDIMLFDRNLTRDGSYPALAVGVFDTLSEFRHYYWQSLKA